MALKSILSVRTAIPFTVVSGSALDLTSPTGAWASIGVDYSNRGAESSPPTLSYVNEVDDTDTNDSGGLGDKLGVLLPLSAEGQVILSSGVVFPQFRRPIAYQGEKRFAGG